MLNRVILMGRIIADPELKTTASGVSVTSFRIAVDRSYVKSGEDRKADFLDVVCWRQQAEFVCRYFGKGSLIAIEGQLQSRTYQAKDGTNRYVVEIVADNVSFTGERRDSGDNHQNQVTSQQGNTQPNNQYAPSQQYAPTPTPTPQNYAVDRNYVNQQQNQPPVGSPPVQAQQPPMPPRNEPAPAYSSGNANDFTQMPTDDDLPF